jgi:hypothetical protein|tara:strand:- start:1606 stop:3657 length:2052 start_codon:yes stop_codon:yes gene_type:complete
MTFAARSSGSGKKGSGRRGGRGRDAFVAGLRKKAQEQKVRQVPSKLVNIAQRSDDAVQNSKKPRVIKIEGEEQKTAAAGDTVPIVFCKRVGSVGGVWLQPPLSKQGSYNFVGIFLYPLSQGEIVSTPATTNTYVGTDQIQGRTGTIPTINKYYSSASSMASSPSSCPITSGKIFCDFDSNYFIGEIRKTSGFVQYGRDFESSHTNNAFLTIGSGDTSNSVIEFTGDNYQAWDSVTGTDVTSAFFTSLGVSDPSSYVFRFNRNPRSGTLIGGFAVGTIDRGATLGTLFGTSAHSVVYGVPFGTSNPVNEKYTNGTINNQVNTSNPATTGTLGGSVSEYAASPVSDPTNPGSGFDFTDYADITFLEIQGNIYDESNADQGEYKTTTRQLSVYIDQGVKVPLYSAGTPGTTGASNQFVDLAMHLFSIIKRSDTSSADIASPIDTSNLQTLATFNTNIGALFNGMIEQSVNIIDFISTMAPFFLLQFVSENGRYAFRPLLPLTAGNQIDGTALTASATFTEANILPDSFQKQYDPADSRRDIQISVAFREVKKERVGLQKTRTVRFSTVSNDVPVEQIDMTDCCTSEAHAELYAKYQLAKRKHSTHAISFETPLLTSSLTVNDVIKVQRQRKNTLGDDRTEIDYYQVTNIVHKSNGVSAISADHFPLNASNISKISNEILSGSFTTI